LCRGLITYRETALLYDPKESSSSDQQRVVVVVAHELAHQWFGNYVTMDWWSGLWLNEGFASYVEYVGTHAVHPEWYSSLPKHTSFHPLVDVMGTHMLLLHHIGICGHNSHMVHNK
jgi:predicted aminopeptidase